MVNIFTFRAAPEITFGAGSVQQLGQKLKNYGVQKLLLVVDQGFAKIGPLAKITEPLEKEGIKFTVFDQVEPEPRVETADECGSLAKKEKFDFIIGVGGGSALDTAKAAAILATNEGRAKDYQGLNKVPRPGIPKGMIPTTAGTGSEVTFTAVFINEAEKKKAGINSPYLFPEIAILDPELTLSLPPAVTAYTGMDALAHAIESFTSLQANFLSEMFSLEAVRKIMKNLRSAVENGQDINARSEMLMGSLLAGIGLANAGVTAVHSLSYPLGGSFRVPHGVGNGLLLPAVMEYNASACPERFARLAEVMQIEVKGLSVAEAALRSVEAVKKLATDIEVPLRLSDLGIPKSALPWMAEEALQVVRPLENNPRPISKEDALRIYEAVF
ncbi:MAG: iron-containing alcohol dehydrogenase [Thermodesulfobacteriota bacterium]